MAKAASRRTVDFPVGRINSLPGRYVTDRQMRFYMQIGKARPLAVAAAKAGSAGGALTSSRCRH